MKDSIDAVRGEEDEYALMRRISHGDVEAFDLVYRRYADRVRAFLAHMSPLRSLVDEALNDTMLTVWRQPWRYDGTCRLSTWIFAIAKRKGLHLLRHARVLAPIAVTEPQARNEPDAEAQMSQLRDWLCRALTTLPLEQLTVLELTYFQGYGCREVASLMECPVETVKTRMFHARRKLRRMLSDARGAPLAPLHRRPILHCVRKPIDAHAETRSC